MKIIVVVPAYNESSHIANVIADLRSAGYSSIIVVNDGSSDDTALIAEQSGARVISHPVPRGYGAALTTGTERALRDGAEYIVHFDGDGQHQASDIQQFIDKLTNGADIVFGSRYLGQSSETPKLKTYLIHKPALAFQTLFTGLRFTDIHNGFRAFTRRAAQSIDTRQDNMAYASEIIGQVKANKLRYAEVPVTIAYHEFGQGFSGGIRILKDLFIEKLIK